MLKLRNSTRLTSFVFDVVAIVVGLTLSFMIDEWRNEKKVRSKESAILEGIRSDLQADIDFANNAIGWTSNDITEKNLLLTADHRQSMKPDSLDRYIGRLGRFNGFMGNDHTYKTIAAEARVLITDEKLRTSLQNYYSYSYGLAVDFAEYDKRLSISRLELIRKNIATEGIKTLRPWYHYDEGPEIDYDDEAVHRIFESEEFRAQIHWSLYSDEIVIRLAEDRITECKRLQALIDQNLKKL